MNRAPYPRLLALTVVTAALIGCGGSSPVSDFKNTTLRVYGGSGLFFSLSECKAVSEAAVATVNGHELVARPGGFNLIDGCRYSYYGAQQTLPASMVAEPANGLIRLEDETGLIEVEVERVLGPYELRSQKAGLREGASSVRLAPGEQLTFDIWPPLPLGSVMVSVNTQSLEPFRSWELSPKIDGATFTVTLPADLPPAEYYLGVQVDAKPRVTRCQGVRTCEATVEFIRSFDFQSP